MVKFGHDFLKKENVTEKFANLFDLSPSDIKGKNSFSDVVSNTAAVYKHVHESKMPEKVINNSDSNVTVYQVIGYDLEMSKRLETLKIKSKQVPVGTKRMAKYFNSEMIINNMPTVYTDEEGNIWSILQS